MGNCIESDRVAASGAQSSPTTIIDIKERIEKWLANGFHEIRRAQQKTSTKHGLRVFASITPITITRKEVEAIRHESDASEQVRLIMNPPFSEISRITDHLFLTGVGGLTTENFATLHIRMIVNVTYEMPLVVRQNLASIRIPVDDDPDDCLYPYLDEVTDLIHTARRDHIRTVVHCVAGASRSATIVIAYLVKHCGFSLKHAFCYVNAARECARPNMGFFRELIRFEQCVRHRNSVRMAEYALDDTGSGKICVPDCYRSDFPELFQAEARKQLRRHDVCENDFRRTDDTERATADRTNIIKTSKRQLQQLRSLNMRRIAPVSKMIYLRETYDEINRIRSCYSKSKSNINNSFDKSNRTTATNS